MKILHYVDENRLAWGETWIQLIKELAAQGTQNFVVCRAGGTLSGRLKEEKLDYAESKPLVQALPFTNLTLGKIIERERPDIIHTRLSAAALIGGWWGKHMGVPVVETIDKYPKIKYYRDASMIFPCSNAVRDHMAREGFPVDKMTVVYNPVDIPRYKRDMGARKKVRAEHGIADSTKIILGAGRFVDWKGFEYLIEGYAALLKNDGLPETRLWLVGDGPEMARYKGLVKELGIEDKTLFPGFAQDIRGWLWASDILVQPSQSPEGFSLMLLEAMAAGLPCIATNIGGTLDIIKDGKNGWLMGTGHENGLAEKLNTVLRDKKLLAATAANAVKSASVFNVHDIAAQTIKIYSKVIQDYAKG